MYDPAPHDSRSPSSVRKRIDRPLISILSIFLVALAWGCDASVNQAEETQIGPTEIWIEKYRFLPLHQYSVPGATVTWVNRDTLAHTVVSGTPDDPGRWFESDTIEPGGTFSHTFYHKENYPYHCSLHPDRIRTSSDIPVLLVTPLVQPTGSG